MRQVGVNKLLGNGKDQVWLKKRIVFGIESRKDQAGVGILEGCKRRRNGVADKVNPLDKMRHFIATDAQHDLQHLSVRDFLREGRIEAAASLFDHAKNEKPPCWQWPARGQQD